MARRRWVIEIYCDWGVRRPVWDGRNYDEWGKPGQEALVQPALRLTSELLERLSAWADEWKDWEYPRLTDPSAPEWPAPDREDWRLRGEELAAEVQQQLGPSYEVRYRYPAGDESPYGNAVNG